MKRLSILLSTLLSVTVSAFATVVPATDKAPASTARWNSLMQALPYSAVASGPESPVPNADCHGILNEKLNNVRRNAADSIRFVGSVVYTGNASLRPMGLYSFSEGGYFTTLFKGLRSTGGGCLARDLFHSVTFTSPAPGIFSTTYMKLNPETWKRTGGANLSIADIAGSDMAYDITTDNVYGCFYNSTGTGFVFGYADFELKKRTVVRELDEQWFGVMADAAGQIYVIDSKGDLLKVDKNTGGTTRVGATGLAPYYMSSATIDPVSGRCFFTVSTDSHRASLYEINLTSGLAVKIFDFPYNEEVTALGVISQAVNPKAPATATALSPGFTDGAMTGSVTFSMPVTTADGAPAVGNIRYRFLADGKIAAEGNAAYGAKMTVPVSVENPGNTRFTVILFNDAGYSLPARTSMFVGNGTPRNPSPTLSVSGNVCMIKWNAVTSTVAGGYFSTSELFYKVTRISDGEVIADSLQTTQISDTLNDSERLQKHQYSVQAFFRGNFSSVGKTASQISGSIIKPPFHDNFDNKSLNALFTVIDCNGDGKSWNQISSSMGGLGCVGTTLPMDDWAITPPVQMKKGYTYRIKANISAGYASKSSEKVELRWGTLPSVAGMTGTLLPPTVIDHSEDRIYSGWITPDADGLYYIGIHGISDASSFRLDVEDICIEAPRNIKAPGLPCGLGITPDQTGAPAATFTFSAPAVAIDGSPLNGEMSVEVTRGDSRIAQFNDVTPGQSLRFEDNMTKPGLQSYSITATNQFGSGMPLETSVFLGINAPSDVTGLSLSENSARPGQVTISWSAPTVDKDGNPINPALISYTVTRLKTSGEEIIASDIKTCSYTYQAVQPGAEQEFIAFGVYAVTKGGKSAGKGTPTISAGTPYPAPYRESFANARIKHSLGINRLAGKPQWIVAGNSTFTDIKSADNDGGFMVMKGENLLDSARLYSGKIDLTKLKTPALTFFTYNIADNGADINSLCVEVNEGNGWTTLKTATVNDMCLGRSGWQRVEVDMKPYAGKTVQIAFTATIHLYAFVMIDAVRIGDMADSNLAVSAIKVPDESRPGEPVSIEVEISNDGRTEASGYSLKLSRLGEPIMTMVCDSTIAPGLKRSFILTDTLSVIHPENVEYRAEVSWNPDTDNSDNSSSPAVTALSLPVWPSPSALSAKDRGMNGVLLKWQEPDLQGGSAPVTENFESYPAYANSGLGQWTLVDADKGNIGAIQGIAIPGIDQGSLQSWFVMSSDLREDNPTFAAHSGKQYLSNMYAASGSGAIACDDWLISPLLSGKEQTISFWAKSYNAKYLESFKIMASSSGTGLTDFTEVATRTDIADSWTEYTVTLPAGTRYFAIRCVSFDRMMMFVDDITYQPAVGGGMELLGYNVYCDGIQINKEPIRETTFTDNNVVKGSHRYQVTALYSAGESRPCSPVDCLYTAVNGISADEVDVMADSGKITIQNAAGMYIDITSLTGIRIYSGQCTASNLEISVTQGVYIVRAGSRTCRIIVN